MSIRTDFAAAFMFQAGYKRHLVKIAREAIRVDVAGWEDDAKRNTDFMVARMENGLRVTARVRQPEYRKRYGDQFTVRLNRPSGVPSEMAKIRDGFGDFGVYGFASPSEPGRLVQWCLYNLALLRQYLELGGRWHQERNADGSSDFAVFDVNEVAGFQLGFVLSSGGLRVDAWPPAEGDCRVCGHPTWIIDEAGPVHGCCLYRPHVRWGWPT